MCGRYVSTASTAELLDQFDIDQVLGDDLAPSWNIAPTQQVRIVARRSRDATGGDADTSERCLAGGESPRDDVVLGKPVTASDDSGEDDCPRPDDITDDLVRQLRTVHWGLVPHWAKDPAIGTRMINARSETVAAKPAFRAAATRRRCLIPADGYYEWMAATTGSPPGRKGSKTPYFLHRPDGQPFAMAGLYEIWRDPTVPEDDPERLLWTCTVITRSAPDSLGHIHDRSPVIVPGDLQQDWLDCSGGSTASATRTVEDLLAAIQPPQLVPREVGRAVGNVRNNRPDLIKPVTTPAPAPSFEPPALW